MRKSISFIVLACVTICSCLNAQQVQSINIAVNQPSYNGACPVSIAFTATIHYSGAGALKYTWLRSDGGKGATGSILLDMLHHSTVLQNTWYMAKNMNGWMSLQIISPVSFQSPQANFSVACSSSNSNPARSNVNASGNLNNPTKGKVTSSGTTNNSSNGNVTNNSGVVNNPKKLFAIQNIIVRVDKPAYKGTCPVTLSFNAIMHSNGSGIIQYTWVTSDGGINPVLSQKLSGTGTDQLQVYNWELGKNYSGSVSLKILSPITYQSAAAKFNVNCNVISVPTPTIRSNIP